MTAVALSPKHGAAVQLSDDAVHESKLSVRPGAELSLNSRKRTASGASTNGAGGQYGSSREPTDWRNPSRSSSMEPEARIEADLGEGSPLRHPASLASAQESTKITARPTSRTASAASAQDLLGPRLTPQHSPNRRVNGHDSPSQASNAPSTPRKTSLAASAYHPRASTGSSSTVSGVTSNSSFPATPAPSSFPNSPRQRGTSGNDFPRSASAADLDPTAALIRKLYARLEEQGVPGDGWDEGRERSRDGIINRELAEGFETMRLSPEQMRTEDKGEAVLKRVDRYGFFSASHPAALASQHHRLATLSASACSSLPSTSSSRRTSLTSRRSVSNSSAPLPPNMNPHRLSTASLAPDLSPASVALEIKRVDKWADMLRVSRRDRGGNIKDWAFASGWWDGRTASGSSGGGGKYRKMQRRVFKGIPDRWRRAVWGVMIEKMASETGGGPALEQLEEEYRFLLDEPSAQDVQIDLDVPRTISGHVLFHTRYGQGQRALFHVLHAFGLHCDAMGGYCQGMGPIAATLLCYFEPERAYAGLVRLFDQYQLKHIFEPGFPGLVEAFYVQERLVEMLMPDVHIAFTEHGISTSSYATKWYITLFANSVPFATQLRFWDGLLLEGLDFLVVAAVSIIWCLRDQFTAADASFESILSGLSSYFIVESDDALLRWIRKTLRMKDLRPKLQKWRKEWASFVADGTADRHVT